MDPFLTEILTSFGTSLAVRGIEGPFKTLDLYWENLMYNVNHKLEKGLLDKQAAIDFKSEISSELQKIPDEYRQEPRKSIIANALDSSINSLEENPIREMYAKLIASACDSRKSSDLHPSFIEIVKQLSPTDALLLEQLRKMDKTPSAQYFTSTLDGGEINLSDTFVLPLIDDYRQTVNGIDNLERLRLINIPTSRYLVDQTSYSIFETDIIKADILRQNNTLDLKIALDQQKSLNNPARNIGLLDDIDIRKGYIAITSFGLSFIRCCVS